MQERWAHTPVIRFLAEEEYLNAIDAGVASGGTREIELRVLAWRAANDCHDPEAAKKTAELAAARQAVATAKGRPTEDSTAGARAQTRLHLVVLFPGDADVGIVPSRD